jgi:hypothetical protein
MLVTLVDGAVTGTNLDEEIEHEAFHRGRYWHNYCWGDGQCLVGCELLLYTALARMA